jgi:hypothetical protein
MMKEVGEFCDLLMKKIFIQSLLTFFYIITIFTYIIDAPSHILSIDPDFYTSESSHKQQLRIEQSRDTCCVDFASRDAGGANFIHMICPAID